MAWKGHILSKAHSLAWSPDATEHRATKQPSEVTHIQTDRKTEWQTDRETDLAGVRDWVSVPMAVYELHVVRPVVSAVARDVGLSVVAVAHQHSIEQQFLPQYR